MEERRRSPDSFIKLYCLIIVLIESTNGKSGGGHYSSQRSLGATGGSMSHSAGNAALNSMAWNNPWLMQDVHGFYDQTFNDSDPIPDEQRLMAQLLRNYDPSARPVYNASDTVSVAFGIALTQLSDMDEKNQVLTTNIWLEQEWFDQRLTWNASDYNGLTTLRLPCSKIWLPDIVLYNSADDYTQGFYQSKAMVDSNGHVFWPPPAKFRSSCKIDVTFFPFDDQLCKLKFGSWTYDAAQVNLTKRRDNVDMTNYIRSGEWHIVHIAVRRNDVTYPCCPGIYYPDVTIYVHIRRRILYYLFNIIFPCIWLSILSLLGFWLPPDSGEKITLGITVLLAFSVFMLLIAESMPATSEMVPLIEIYLTIVMALTSLSIVLTVYVLQLHHSGPVVIPIPYSFKYSLVRHIAPMVGMRQTVYLYAKEHNLIEIDPIYRCFMDDNENESPGKSFSRKKNLFKYRSETTHRHYNDRNDHTSSDDHDESPQWSRKSFLPASVVNGDLAQRGVRQSPPRKRDLHRSRSRAHIVLIPQNYPNKMNPSPMLEDRNHQDLFHSNLFLLEKHLKSLIDKQKQEQDRNEIVNEWKLMALIMDRLLFWIFTALTLISSVLCLIIVPYLKNSGYIRALSKDLMFDFKASELLNNVIEQQLKNNSATLRTDPN